MRNVAVAVALVLIVSTSGCARAPAGGAPASTERPPEQPAATATAANAGRIGSPERPFVLVNVPFLETQRLSKGMEAIGARLEQETGLVFRTAVPTSYAAVVEALCAGRADAAFISPLPYVLAHQMCGADMRLVSISYGATSYRGELIVRADSPLGSLADLRGTRIAWAEPSSTSGYLYPRALVAEAGLDPDRDFAQQTFAGGHDKVVIAVLNGQVDVGATYEGIEASAGLLATYPDVAQRIRVLAKTPDIPNDGVAFRQGLTPDVEQRVVDGLLRIAEGPSGAALFAEAMGTSGLAPTDDAAYEPVRRAARTLGLDLEAEIRRLP